jgi:hypothetical protein
MYLQVEGSRNWVFVLLLRKRPKLKKFVVPVVAAFTLAAVGGIAGAAPDKDNTKKVESKVTLKFDPGNSTDPYDPYADAMFFGKVKALNVSGSDEKKCENNRTVRIKRLQPGEDPTFGTATTDKDGKYSLPASEAYQEGGQYRAKVERRKRNKANLNCLPDRSDPITVP